MQVAVASVKCLVIKSVIDHFLFPFLSLCLWVPYLYLIFKIICTWRWWTKTCYQNAQENGHSSMYTWILSTGWWRNQAPVNPDAVVVVGFLCTCLIGGFIYINRYFFILTLIFYLCRFAFNFISGMLGPSSLTYICYS